MSFDPERAAPVYFEARFKMLIAYAVNGNML